MYIYKITKTKQAHKYKLRLAQHFGGEMTKQIVKKYYKIEYKKHNKYNICILIKKSIQNNQNIIN